MDFDPVIDAYLAGKVVNVVPAAKFDFATGAQYLWNGRFNFSLGSVTWQGVKTLVNIDGLEDAVGTDAADMNFALSGADSDLMAIAVSEDRADYVRRMVIVYLIFFDADWQPLIAPYALKAGFMNDMQLSKLPVTGSDGQVTGWTRTITLPVSNLFSGRGVPANAFWTDRDQQARFPGDTGLDFIQQLQTTSIPVPWH